MNLKAIHLPNIFDPLIIFIGFQISNGATSATLSNRQLYPYFYRTPLSDVAYNVVRQQLFGMFNWDKIAIIYQTLSLFQTVRNINFYLILYYSIYMQNYQ